MLNRSNIQSSNNGEGNNSARYQPSVNNDARNSFIKGFAKLIELTKDELSASQLSRILGEMARSHRKNKEGDNLQLDNDNALAVITRSLYEKALGVNPRNQRAEIELKNYLKLNFISTDSEEKSEARIQGFENAFNGSTLGDYLLDEISKYSFRMLVLYPRDIKRILAFIVEKLSRQEFIDSIAVSNLNGMKIQSVLKDTIRLINKPKQINDNELAHEEKNDSNSMEVEAPVATPDTILISNEIVDRQIDEAYQIYHESVSKSKLQKPQYQHKKGYLTHVFIVKVPADLGDEEKMRFSNAIISRLKNNPDVNESQLNKDLLQVDAEGAWKEKNIFYVSEKSQKLPIKFIHEEIATTGDILIKGASARTLYYMLWNKKEEQNEAEAQHGVEPKKQKDKIFNGPNPEHRDKHNDIIESVTTSPEVSMVNPLSLFNTIAGKTSNNNNESFSDDSDPEIVTQKRKLAEIKRAKDALKDAVLSKQEKVSGLTNLFKQKNAEYKQIKKAKLNAMIDEEAKSLKALETSDATLTQEGIQLEAEIGKIEEKIKFV